MAFERGGLTLTPAVALCHVAGKCKARQAITYLHLGPYRRPRFRYEILSFLRETPLYHCAYLRAMVCPGIALGQGRARQVTFRYDV